MRFDPTGLMTPLTTLLGIRSGMRVGVFYAPDGFVEAMSPLPPDVHILEATRTGFDCTIFFAAKKVELVERLTRFTQSMALTGSLWVVFPSTASEETMPTEDFARMAAVELGLTDDKRILLDANWTGLRFVWRHRVPRIEIPRATA